MVSYLIRSVPTDTHHALSPSNDNCETSIGRVIRRSGTEPAVVETCLAILGDTDARQTEEIATLGESPAEALERIAYPPSLPALRQLALDYPEFSTRRALLKASAAVEPTPRPAAQHD